MIPEDIKGGYNKGLPLQRIYLGGYKIWPPNKIYVGGHFKTFNGSTQKYLVRLNVDGTKDTTFDIGSGFNNTVNSLYFDKVNQKIYVGGNFTIFNGATQDGLIRLNYDGSKDTSFNIGTGFNHSIYSLDFDEINQKLYVGGLFTTFNGSTQNRLIRLNYNGTKDTTFDIGSLFDYTDVYSIAYDNINQKLYVGGAFGFQNRLLKLNYNGSMDTSFGIVTGFDNVIRTIFFDKTNQKIYVGGAFANFNGSTQNKLIRLNADGTKDTTFDIGTGFSGEVDSLYFDEINQKLYAGGNFGTFKGAAQSRLIRLNYDGSKDTSFNIGTGFDKLIDAISFDKVNQKIYVGGNFTIFNGATQDGLIRLNYDGSKDTSFNVGTGADNNKIKTILYL